jgi:hypothetical protein
MDRKEFLRKGMLGAGAVAGIAAATKLSGEPTPIEERITGFNHIPPLHQKK